jgi:pimeloyl-ACP methyl ester carboxylesterase
MPTVKVADISMYYEDRGKGEALVLIAGFSFNSAFWFLNIPVFPENNG